MFYPCVVNTGAYQRLCIFTTSWRYINSIIIIGSIIIIVVIIYVMAMSFCLFVRLSVACEIC